MRMHVSNHGVKRATLFAVRVVPKFSQRRIAAPAFLLVAILWAIAALTSDLRDILGWLYLAQVVGLAYLYWLKVKGDAYQIFKPSILMMIYIGLTVSAGAIAYSSGSALRSMEAFWALYNRWDNLLATYYLISASFCTAFLVSCAYKVNVVTTPLQGRAIQPSVAYVIIGLLAGTIVVLSLIPSLLISQVVSPTIATAGIFLAFAARLRLRWLIVILIVAAMAILNFHDKRVAIFLFFPAIFLETAIKGRLAVSPRALAGGAIAVFLALYLIGAMSILRGYGSFGDVGILEALVLVPEYLSSPQAFGMVANNTEATYMFIVLHEAVSASIDEGSGVLMYGETFAKVLFVGIPESLFGYKPQSILDSFTLHVDPAFRQIGGSYPPTVIGEAFWNFGWFGLLAVGLICLLMDRLYYTLARWTAGAIIWRSVFALMMFQLLFVFMRGSGADILVVYAAIALFAAFFVRVALLPFGKA